MTQFYCAKDLASLLEIHVRTLKKWAARVKVPPTIRGQACNRWSSADADRLVARIRKLKAKGGSR
jgi:DNA-binding transcriptional MerR regulator